jgi:hypothetical protein
MIPKIKTYLLLLSEEVKSKIKNDFNLDESLFDDYQIFDFVNFYLIRDYILNDDVNKNDLFIEIPEKEFRPNFFSSILHSLTLTKLYQNYFNYQKAIPDLAENDLIYTIRNKEYRIMRVTRKTEEQLSLNYKFPRKNEIGIYDFPLKKSIFTKLNPNLVENKNTVKDIDNYRNFLCNHFGVDFPLLTIFNDRTLVIAEKDFYRESNFLPIKYTTKNGKVSNSLPFFNYMIDCCNDYKTAQKFLTKNSEQFDEVVVIGDAKYKESFSQILQELKWQGRIKNIILIGSYKPDSKNEFREWQWGKYELKIANNEEPSPKNKKVIENNLLLEKLIELKSQINNLKSEKNVDISFLLKYSNFYFRIILKDSHLSKGIYQEYCERLVSYLKSEKFEEELNELFYSQDIYNPETIKESTDKIFQIFQEIAIIISNNNLKWNYIEEKAKTVKNLYLIVEKKSYPILLQQFKNEKINNIKLISDKRIDNTIDYLQTWLNSEDKNIAHREYIIPYLNNMEMFDKLSQLKGNCEVLCYKDIDEIAFDNLVRQFSADEKNKLTHVDRKHFVQAEFSEDEQYLQRQLDDLFKFDLNDEKFKNNPYESIDLPREKVLYEIEFEDGSVDKFESSKGVFLIENKEQINTTIGEVYEGATIRYYQNDNKEDYRKVLDIFDTENLLNFFDTYADSWKQTLQKLSSEYNSIEQLYQQLFNSTYKINYNTFRQYFDTDCITRFPRKETLSAIRDFCIYKGLNSELLVQKLDKFCAYAKKDHSLRQQAGKIMGSDLIDYIASGKIELSDSLKKVPNNILEKLIETIKEKTIKKKTLLEHE